jgi:predicted RND superfamily exporter protein
MKRVIRWSVRNPKTIVVLTLLSTVGFSTQIPRLKIDLDGRSLVPRGDPSLQPSDAAAALFTLRDSVVLGVPAVPGERDVYNSTTLDSVARLSYALKALPGIDANSVVSLATIPRLDTSGGMVSHFPLVRPGAVTPAVAAKVRHETQALGWENGLVVSKDRQFATIFAQILPGANLYALAASVNRLVRQEESASHCHVLLSGTAMAQAALGSATASDLACLVPVCIAVLLVVLYFMLGPFTSGLISLAEVCVSLLLTAGIMGATGQSIFVTTLVLPVILLTVGVADDIFALRNFYSASLHDRSLARPEAIVDAFSSVSPQIFMTAVSTVVGMLSFAWTNLRPMQVFGIFGAVAIGFSTLMTFTLVPALLVLQKQDSLRIQRCVTLERLCTAWYARHIAPRPRFVLAIVAAVILVSALLSSRVRVDDSWISNLPAASAVARSDKTLSQHLGGTTELDFELDSRDPSGFLSPRALDRLRIVEDALRRQPEVGAIQSFYSDTLRVSAALRGQSVAAFQQSLRANHAQLDTPDIAQAELLLSMFPEAQLHRWIDDTHRHTRLAAFIRNADYVKIQSVLNAVAAASSNAGSARPVTPFGDGWISYTTVNLLVVGQRSSLLLAFGTDLLLLSLLFRSFWAALISLIPVAVGMFVVFALLTVFNVPLGIANSMFIAIAIGIGTDFSVHLTSSCREKIKELESAIEGCHAAVHHTAPAILTSITSLSCGFAVLALSQVTPNRQLGLMICASLAACAVAAVVAVPSLFLFRRKSPRLEPAVTSVHDLVVMSNVHE